jgi:hypothetical protein
MSQFTRRSLLAVAAIVVAGRSAAAEANPPALVAYSSFAKQSVKLHAFIGRNIALLLDPSRAVDQTAVSRVVNALDRAWDWYRNYFGQPTPHFTYSGKTTVAEVTQTCGAGCGYLGHTGIELDPPTMSALIKDASGDRYQQAVFYELGRNFWLYGEQLGRISALTTGFAIVNRFYVMEMTGLVGAPWSENVGFDTFRYSILVELLDRYLADATLNWQNTIAVDKAPANPYGWNGNDLAAALYHKIRVDHGDGAYRRFWRLMKGAPPAELPRDSASRFVQIARAVTGTDYRSLLRDRSLPLTIVSSTIADGLARRVTYRANFGGGAVTGIITRVEGNQWFESNDSDRGKTLSFRSLSASTSEILLYDDVRDVYLNVDLIGKKIFWRRGPDRQWSELYSVLAAST